MSRTGLQASPTKKIQIFQEIRTVHLKPITKRAPFTLKPFAGLYNPYPYGCSLLCNHPIDNEARELLQKAKHSWATEGRNLLLSEEIDAIKANMKELERTTIKIELDKPTDSVPEELFRRYTETDSRPLTPAATLVSGVTKASASRRCVTPDPIMANQIKEKTLLVLDLRRSHSQETLSWYGSSSLLEPPIITIQRAPTRSSSFDSLKTKSPRYSPRPPQNKTESPKKLIKAPTLDKDKPKKEDESDSEDEEFVRRRGKKRRRKRDHSAIPMAQGSVDPETQIATIGDDLGDQPGTSAVSRAETEPPEKDDEKSKKLSARTIDIPPIDSFIDWELLKQLRRELDDIVIENEFNDKMKRALKEAYKTLSKNKRDCEDLAKLRKEVKANKIDPVVFLSTPRVFIRSSTIFEFPVDYQSLEGMTPLEYLQKNVTITSSRKFLYRCLFNRLCEATAETQERPKNRIIASDLTPAMDLLMGRPLKNEHKLEFRKLLKWKDEDSFDFRTFCGICAFCERMFSPQYAPKHKSRIEDPPHEVETADFQGFQRKIHGLKLEDDLLTVLDLIHTH